MAHLILYENANFGGRSKDVFQNQQSLGDFNRVTSSFKVLEGHWQFFTNTGYQGPTPGSSSSFAPGTSCTWVKNLGIPNDAIQSVRLVG
jgi:hypothetical protein